jgi:hypothetical protein
MVVVTPTLGSANIPSKIPKRIVREDKRVHGERVAFSAITVPAEPPPA